MYAGTRRTFLVGLGRFMAVAAGTAILKPPVLYSFPSVIRPRRDFTLRFVMKRLYGIEPRFKEYEIHFRGNVWTAQGVYDADDHH